MFRRELYDKQSLLVAARWHIVDLAHELLGSPVIKYRNRDEGMCPKAGFDCSGIIKYLLESANDEYDLGLKPPRHANELFREFGEVVDYTRRGPGDLVFFPTRRLNGRYAVTHVGLVVAREFYIHSPGQSDDQIVELGLLPEQPEPIPDATEDDAYGHTPAAIKRLTLPVGEGRWHAR